MSESVSMTTFGSGFSGAAGAAGFAAGVLSLCPLAAGLVEDAADSFPAGVDRFVAPVFDVARVGIKL